MRVVGLTELQSTAPNKTGNYVGKILKKGYIHIYIHTHTHTYLIILDLHLCPCTFDIVRADSSELKTPELKEARLLEKSQERCQ